MELFLSQRHFFLTIGIAALFCGSCSKNDRNVLFEYPMPRMEFEIPAGLNPIETHYFNIQSVPTSSDTLFQSFGYNESDVAWVAPKSARLFSIGAGGNYDFIYEISVMICPEGETKPNCGPEIFYRLPVPANTGDFLDLIPNEFNAKSLLLAERVNYQIKLVSLRNTTPQFIFTRFDVKFSAEAE